MRVRITRAPTGVVDGIPLKNYHAGVTYDLSPVLAEYLVAEGFAALEMRQHRRSTRRRETDRRSRPGHSKT
jgi:hypothetical protein